MPKMYFIKYIFLQTVVAWRFSVFQAALHQSLVWTEFLRLALGINAQNVIFVVHTAHQATMNPCIEQSTLQFLSDLRQNNQRDWFQAHRDDYRQAADNFAQVLQALIDGLAKIDPALQGLSPARCTYRIYNDMRFHNKPPYKTHLAAYITPNGKNTGTAGFYLHIEPGASMFIGGIYKAPTRVMQSIREDISFYRADFEKIIAPLKHLHFLEADSLKQPPRGVEAHPSVVEYLKMRSICPTQTFADAEVMAHDFVAQCLHLAAKLHPLNQFINRAVAMAQD